MLPKPDGRRPLEVLLATAEGKPEPVDALDPKPEELAGKEGAEAGVGENKPEGAGDAPLELPKPPEPQLAPVAAGVEVGAASLAFLKAEMTSTAGAVAAMGLVPNAKPGALVAMVEREDC